MKKLICRLFGHNEARESRSFVRCKRCGCGRFTAPAFSKEVIDILKRNTHFLALAVFALAASLSAQVSNPSTPLLAESGIPVIVAPNGTVATNGTVTLGTALPWIPAFAWLRLPAAAVSGGSAGVYYATCTSTTVCQVYTNFVDPATTAFTPFVPSSPVAAVGSNSAYTQVTTAVSLLNVSVGAGAIGANGTLRKTVLLAVNNNADAKTLAFILGGTSYASISEPSVLQARLQIELHNAGDQSHQFSSAFGTMFGAGAGASPSQFSINTATTQPLLTQCTLAVATDYCIVVQNLDEIFQHN